jgi:hypothetical protein
MVYNNYLGVVHAWLLLVEVFFKGVHLESEKKPIHIIYFIGYLSAKYLPPFFQLIPSHIKLNLVLLLMKMYPDFYEITQIKMCLSSINHEDE